VEQELKQATSSTRSGNTEEQNLEGTGIADDMSPIVYSEESRKQARYNLIAGLPWHGIASDEFKEALLSKQSEEGGDLTLAEPTKPPPCDDEESRGAGGNHSASSSDPKSAPPPGKLEASEFVHAIALSKKTADHHALHATEGAATSTENLTSSMQGPAALISPCSVNSRARETPPEDSAAKMKKRKLGIDVGKGIWKWFLQELEPLIPSSSSTRGASPSKKGGPTVGSTTPSRKGGPTVGSTIETPQLQQRNASALDAFGEIDSAPGTKLSPHNAGGETAKDLSPRIAGGDKQATGLSNGAKRAKIATPKVWIRPRRSLDKHKLQDGPRAIESNKNEAYNC